MDPQPQRQSNTLENSSVRPEKAGETSWRVMNIPNALSLLRLILTMVGVALLTKQQISADIWALGFFAAAILTDTIDGYLAKRLHQISRAGLILDPVADKICILAALIVLMINRGFPIWAGVFLIARDAIVLAGSNAITRRTKIIVPSRILSRIALSLTATTLILFIMRLTVLWQLALYMTIIFNTLSVVDYIRIYFRMTRRSTPGPS
jgi:CDP-diacylglycerol--glycerol-3-phosphate 3-phosphatidyltransferase